MLTIRFPLFSLWYNQTVRKFCSLTIGRGINLESKLKAIEEVLTHYRYYQNIPGMAVSIVAEQEIVYSRGFGISALDSEYATVTPNTIFSIQDVTTNFTALSLVHLEENTSFKLDIPIVEYLPYFRTKSGAYDQITTRHILSHTAGFPENVGVVLLLDEGFRRFAKDMPEYRSLFNRFPNIEETVANMQTREDLTRYFANVELADIPGENWVYAPEAYVIAADVLEKVSGLTWEAYVEKYILTPFGMNRTFINPVFDANENDVAEYYMKAIDQPISVPMPRNDLGAPIGFIYSTANDMATYMMKQMKKRENILSASGWETMHTPAGKRKNGMGYGLGWSIKQRNGRKVVEHAGRYLGVSSFITMMPEHEFGIALLCNMDMIQLGKLADRMMNIWFR